MHDLPRSLIPTKRTPVDTHRRPAGAGDDLMPFHTGRRRLGPAQIIGDIPEQTGPRPLRPKVTAAQRDRHARRLWRPADDEFSHARRLYDLD
jgi:hypothetical protein